MLTSKGLSTWLITLMCCMVSAPPSASQSEASVGAELVRLEAARLHAESVVTTQELIELSGDFGGHGSVAWDVMENVEPSLDELRSQFESLLLTGLEPADVEATLAFWQSAVGGKLLWLRRESTTSQGWRGLARSGRYIAERTSPERLELLQAVDAAVLESQTSAEVAGVLFGLIEAMAEQVSAATGEEAEWAESPEEIRGFLDGQYRSERFRALLYLLSRLDDGELQLYLDFARSPAGIAFFTARRAARVASASTIVETMLPKLQAKLAEELWEYEREEEDQGDEQEDGDS